MMARIAFLLPLLLLFGGCGAKVVFEDGGGGSAAQSTGSAGTTVPPGPLGEACSDACRVVGPCLDDPDSCMPGCLSVPSACQKPFITFLECVSVSFVAACRTTSVCSAELEAYVKCTGACPQYPPTCTSGCDCTQPACNPNETFGYRCETLDNAIDCECLRNGESIGSCKAYGGECSGPIGSSCCGALLFTPAPEG